MKPFPGTLKRYLCIPGLLILAIVSGCNMPTSQDQAIVRPDIVEKAQVILTTVSIQPLETEEQIEFVIVDEVTGLPYQKERMPMSIMQDGSYGLVYQAPIGTVLTYYFQKINADGSIVPEVNAKGLEPRYRMLHVSKPGLVKETIAGWSDTAAASEFGELSGTIVTDELGEPLADILVSAGGLQTITDGDGRYSLYPLVPGNHTLTAISTSGTYLPTQHNTQTGAGTVTLADLNMTPSPWKEVTFKLKAPAETIEGAPIRLAGNLVQLGNTFQDLGGGISGDAARMPVLNSLENGWYSLQMILPAGIDIRYKYTLGDGFWNAEHGLDQKFVTHQLIMPLDSENIVIEDQVATWRTSQTETIWFRAEVPTHTPEEETIGIQFSIADWMPAVPMIKIGEHSWVFPLISPHNFSGEIPYRYCRQTPCSGLGQAGIEEISVSRQIPTNFTETHVNFEPIADWAFYSSAGKIDILKFSAILPQGEEFIAGVALSPFSLHPMVTETPGEHMILSPAWVTNPTAYPRLLAPALNTTIPEDQLSGMIRAAHDQGKTISLHPQVLFQHGADKWWQSQPTSDERFWHQFLAEYKSFVYQYADLAASSGADEIILGGDWLLPALPVNDNFTFYTQPGNIESIWEDVLKGVNERFSGKVGFVLDSNMAEDPPAFLSLADRLYLIWDQPMDEIDPDKIGDALDETAEALYEEAEKPIVIMLAIPSVQGFHLSCIPSPNDEGDCLETSTLKLGPGLENPAATDLAMQAAYYQTFLNEASRREWIAGIISQGYYPDLALHDSSASIHGKPAEAIFEEWMVLISGN